MLRYLCYFILKGIKWSYFCVNHKRLLLLAKRLKLEKEVDKVVEGKVQGRNEACAGCVGPLIPVKKELFE